MAIDFYWSTVPVVQRACQHLGRSHRACKGPKLPGSHLADSVREESKPGTSNKTMHQDGNGSKDDMAVAIIVKAATSCCLHDCDYRSLTEHDFSRPCLLRPPTFFKVVEDFLFITLHHSGLHQVRSSTSRLDSPIILITADLDPHLPRLDCCQSSNPQSIFIAEIMSLVLPTHYLGEF